MTTVSYNPHAQDDKDIAPQHIEAPKADADLTLQDAVNAETVETTMGVLAALRTYPRACLWSAIIAVTIVMESYQNSLIGNFYALPAFRERFGVYVNETAGYQIPARWQTVLSQAANIGGFVGILICGRVAPRLGYRWTIIGALACMNAFIFLTFFATSLGMLLAGELLLGLTWGFFIATAPAYASEVAPLPLRGVLTSYIQICWCIGSFIASGVLYPMSSRTDHWSYRIPFAVQWAFPLPLIALAYLAPESPWWLVRRGRVPDAERSLARLGYTDANVCPKDMVAMIQRTLDLEAAQTGGSSYRDCFKGSDLRRTIIVCAMFAYQLFTGLLIGFQAVYFFQQAGMDTSKSFALGLGNNAIQTVAVGFSWVLGSYCGRRTIYLWGVGFNAVACLLIGITASLPKTSATLYAQAAFVILSYTMYGLTIGPVTYTIISETSSVRLRAQSIALARASYYVSVIWAIVLTSYMLNPAELNLQGRSAFVWLGTCVFCWTTAYFYLPECKGRTYRELDELFRRGVPARQFARTQENMTEDL